MFESIPPREMYAMLRDAKADIMLSGGRTQFIALKAKTPWLDINQERHEAYAGYDGADRVGRGHRAGALQPGLGSGAKPAPFDADGRLVTEALAPSAPPDADDTAPPPPSTTARPSPAATLSTMRSAEP